jgi:hypothetical protein
LATFVGCPHQLVIDGILRGAWKRVTTPRGIRLEIRPLRPLSRKELDALAAAVARFERFVATTVTFTVA